MTNPTIEELQNSNEFELIAEVEHAQIKAFVISQFTETNYVVRFYMYYQAAMVVLGIFILTRGLVQAIRDNIETLIFGLGALVFSFTILVPIHELLHGLALKLTGVKKVNYGAYFRKFIFYAEADRYVLNQQQFTLVALAPLIIIQVLTLAGVIAFWNSGWVFAFGMVMALHSLFCSGDIGLLSVFYQKEKSDVYTFDVKAEKKSYYYRRKRI